jgi:hypothetical protein
MVGWLAGARVVACCCSRAELVDPFTSAMNMVKIKNNFWSQHTIGLVWILVDLVKSNTFRARSVWKPLFALGFKRSGHGVIHMLLLNDIWTSHRAGFGPPTRPHANSHLCLCMMCQFRILGTRTFDCMADDLLAA